MAIQFLYHDNIQKEIFKLERKFPAVRQGFSAFERLCEIQFHPTAPRQIITPAKLHRLAQNSIWSLWKAELVIPKSGLRPNQWPRLWFAVKGSIIVFLCIASHTDNYDDEEIKNTALSRTSDFF